MTKEEARDLLNDLIGMIEDNHNSDYDTALRMGIKAIDQTTWIPVSQPPKESRTYLVSMRYATHDVVKTMSYSTDLHWVDEYEFPKHEAGWYDYDSEYGYYKIENVIVAYMPSPKPYKAEKEE